MCVGKRDRKNLWWKEPQWNRKEEVMQMQSKRTWPSGKEGKINRTKPSPGVEIMDLSRRSSHWFECAQDFRFNVLPKQASISTLQTLPVLYFLCCCTCSADTHSRQHLYFTPLLFHGLMPWVIYWLDPSSSNLLIRMWNRFKYFVWESQALVLQ